MSNCHRMTLAQFGRLAPIEEDALDVAQIALLLDDVVVKETRLEALKGQLNAMLERRYGAAARQLHGFADATDTVTLLDGDFSVKAALPREVTWDQKKLAKLAETIFHDWNRDPEEYINISYTVEEQTYLSWAADLQERFDDARTVGVGKPRFELTAVARERLKTGLRKTRAV